jgi:hypothetical protein
MHEHFGVGVVGKIMLGKEGFADNILTDRRLA